jgi:glycine cleavage system H lipoate-binding protein
MVVVLVVLTILALLALDYFVLSKRREMAEAAAPTLSAPEPLSRTVGQLPAGVFVQPGFTWSRIRENGDVATGVHPLVIGLVGEPYRVELMKVGESVERGEPFLQVGRGDRRLTLRSPVAGRIAEVNPDVARETARAGVRDRDGSWLYRITPTHLDEEIPTWMVAERAAQWTRRQYEQLGEFFSGLVQEEAVGVTMADGGEIPTGILTKLDDRAWKEFQSFIDA